MIKVNSQSFSLPSTLTKQVRRKTEFDVIKTRWRCVVISAFLFVRIFSVATGSWMQGWGVLGVVEGSVVVRFVGIWRVKVQSFFMCFMLLMWKSYAVLCCNYFWFKRERKNTIFFIKTKDFSKKNPKLSLKIKEGAVRILCHVLMWGG